MRSTSFTALAGALWDAQQAGHPENLGSSDLSLEHQAADLGAQRAEIRSSDVIFRDLLRQVSSGAEVLAALVAVVGDELIQPLGGQARFVNGRKLKFKACCAAHDRLALLVQLLDI